MIPNLKCLIIFSILLFGTAGYCLPATARDDTKPLNQSQSTSPEDSASNMGSLLVHLYREYISPVDGDRCPSIPTCSTYSIQAFQKHGFFMGWLMTVDRLIHEGKEETDVSPIVYSGGKWRIFDPLENNDFWWFHNNPTEKGKHE